MRMKVVAWTAKGVVNLAWKLGPSDIGFFGPLQIFGPQFISFSGQIEQIAQTPVWT